MNINQHKPSHSVYWICWNSVIISMFQFPSNRTYSTLFFFVFFLMGADDCKTSSNQPLIKIRHYMALQTRERKTTMLHVLDEKYTQCEFFFSTNTTTTTTTPLTIGQLREWSLRKAFRAAGPSILHCQFCLYKFIFNKGLWEWRSSKEASWRCCKVQCKCTKWILLWTGIHIQV